MKEEYISISENPIQIKGTPNARSESIQFLYQNEHIMVSETNGSWLKCQYGWIYSLDNNGGDLLNKTGITEPDEEIEQVQQSNKPVTSLTPEQVKAEADKKAADAKAKEIAERTPEQRAIIAAQDAMNAKYAASNNVLSEYTEDLRGLNITSLQGIHGMPYQFMAIADTREDESIRSIGRKYSERIVAKMPLLLMTPGNAEFLSSYSSDEKKGFIEFALNIAKDKQSSSDLDELLGREGRYYTLKPDYPAYFQHVNPMCRSAAEFLGIGDEVIGGSKTQEKTMLKNYEWSNMTNSGIHNALSYNGASAFYINSETQISDSFSNNTTQSMLANKANQLSDMGREINFLLGGASAKAGLNFDAMTGQKHLQDNIQNTQDFAKGILGGGGSFMKDVIGGFQTVFAGGKLVFPEIWSDSNFARSYDVHIKLTTPDCDKLSWYLNICVPLLHLIGFTAPRQAGVNGYLSPFLVRAFYKGLFNCDMGIITHMNISKGSEGGWTKDGLPTTIDVTFGIKDLYSIMSMTNGKGIKQNIMNNIVLMDYIANMCGVNINEPDIKRVISMYYNQRVRNKITDKVRLDIAGGLDQWFTNKVLNIYGKF